MKASQTLKKLLNRLNDFFVDDRFSLSSVSDVMVEATHVCYRILNLADENCAGCVGGFRCIGDRYCKSHLEVLGYKASYRRKYKHGLKLTASKNEWPADLSPQVM